MQWKRLGGLWVFNTSEELTSHNTKISNNLVGQVLKPSYNIGIQIRDLKCGRLRIWNQCAKQN
jgi:hypothetical protein